MVRDVAFTLGTPPVGYLSEYSFSILLLFLSPTQLADTKKKVSKSWLLELESEDSLEEKVLRFAVSFIISGYIKSGHRQSTNILSINTLIASEL